MKPINKALTNNENRLFKEAHASLVSLDKKEVESEDMSHLSKEDNPFEGLLILVIGVFPSLLFIFLQIGALDVFLGINFRDAYSPVYYDNQSTASSYLTIKLFFNSICEAFLWWGLILFPINNIKRLSEDRNLDAVILNTLGLGVWAGVFFALVLHSFY